MGRICPFRFGEELLEEEEGSLIFGPEAKQLCIGAQCAWWDGKEEACVVHALVSWLEDIGISTSDISALVYLNADKKH